MSAANVLVHLVEGFVSGEPWAEHDHHKVAAVLRDRFLGNGQCEWHIVAADGGSVVSALDWLDSASPKDPPVILRPIA